ncbi:hypothetical protein RFI_01151 [Reticulomyxa filosa]|uniref:Kelch motif family protein n=1 Tax=Reticulomyxa filosa TaxID=46433 RepID=X6PCK2_RETFI|nr:hypothetical protein RFI_01151 [Reticulomyxa filosa]|eukprot:ETO35911.1 hypothetical protein RFI_01151 [Reticulomyxa filosa]
MEKRDFLHFLTVFLFFKKELCPFFLSMGNRFAIQNSSKRQSEQSNHLTTSTTFENLKSLPIALHQSQCVLHKHELLICGGYLQRNCYSYHTIKNEYKFICEYPNDITLLGHCVVKMINNKNKDNNNEITLLSFGGSLFIKRHTLIMKYVSVWSNKNINDKENYNQWIPFTDNHNYPIIIGRDKDLYQGVRAIIDKKNSNLLFITYRRNNISVFDFNTFQFIKHDILPTDNWIQFHCFVSISKSKSKNLKEKKYEMLLFCYDTGLLIQYYKDYNTFQFYKISVCNDISRFNGYAYLCIHNIILFFGGWNDTFGNNTIFSKSIHTYSIQENKWTTFQNILPSTLYDCAAILSEDNIYMHIIGGRNDKNVTLSTHMKTKVRIWNDSQLVIFYFYFLIKHKYILYCMK